MPSAGARDSFPDDLRGARLHDFGRLGRQPNVLFALLRLERRQDLAEKDPPLLAHRLDRPATLGGERNDDRAPVDVAVPPLGESERFEPVDETRDRALVESELAR